jgi:hypothetical protein
VVGGQEKHRTKDEDDKGEDVFVGDEDGHGWRVFFLDEWGGGDEEDEEMKGRMGEEKGWK